jgi:hypothetical protein
VATAAAVTAVATAVAAAVAATVVAVAAAADAKRVFELTRTHPGAVPAGGFLFFARI